MERRAPRTRRGWTLCGLVLVGGSLLPAGCTRSPREVFEKAWGPVRNCAAQVRGRQAPGCGDGGAATTAGIDPTRDPFLAESLADASATDAQGGPAGDWPAEATPDSLVAGGSDSSASDPASAGGDPFLAFVIAESSGGDADAPESAGSDESDASDTTRRGVTELLRTARIHQEAGRLRDAYRDARSAEALAVMSNLEYGPGEDDPAKLVRSLRSELGLEGPASTEDVATAEPAPRDAEPEPPADPFAELFAHEAATTEPSPPPAVPEAAQAEAAPDFDPFAAEPLAPEAPAPQGAAPAPVASESDPPRPAAPDPALPTVVGAPVRTASLSGTPAHAGSHGVRITAGPSMIVESQRVPSRFSDLRSRFVARSNNGPAYAGIVTTSGRRGRPLVELAIPEEALQPVRVTANETGVIEIEAPGEKAEIIPGLALEEASREALPPEEFQGLVPMPLEPASPAEALAAAPEEAPVEAVQPAPLPSDAPGRAPSAGPKDTTEREVPNVRWDDEPAPVAAVRRTNWLPLAAGGGLALLGLIAFWLRR